MIFLLFISLFLYVSCQDKWEQIKVVSLPKTITSPDEEKFSVDFNLLFVHPSGSEDPDFTLNSITYVEQTQGMTATVLALGKVEVLDTTGQGTDYMKHSFSIHLLYEDLGTPVDGCLGFPEETLIFKFHYTFAGLGHDEDHLIDIEVGMTDLCDEKYVYTLDKDFYDNRSPPGGDIHLLQPFSLQGWFQTNSKIRNIYLDKFSLLKTDQTLIRTFVENQARIEPAATNVGLTYSNKINIDLHTVEFDIEMTFGLPEDPSQTEEVEFYKTIVQENGEVLIEAYFEIEYVSGLRRGLEDNDLVTMKKDFVINHEDLKKYIK